MYIRVHYEQTAAADMAIAGINDGGLERDWQIMSSFLFGGELFRYIYYFN